MIGNDIVDLQLAEKESDWKRPGFLEKQFTLDERQLISNSENPFQLVWLFWSMKESAYKIWVQKNNKRKFSPQSFQCKLNSDDKGIVVYENHKYYTFSIIDGYYIFTQASVEKDLNAFSLIGSPIRMEKELKKRLEEKTGFSASEIEKRKSSLGVPNFYHKEKRLTKSCSISHHGNYGAFSLLIE